MSIPPEIRAGAAPEETACWAKVIHPDDAGILATAVAAQPDYLITGDTHFFENPNIAGESGLNIVTPAQFLARLKESGPA